MINLLCLGIIPLVYQTRTLYSCKCDPSCLSESFITTSKQSFVAFLPQYFFKNFQCRHLSCIIDLSHLSYDTHSSHIWHETFSAGIRDVCSPKELFITLVLRSRWWIMTEEAPPSGACSFVIYPMALYVRQVFLAKGHSNKQKTCHKYLILALLVRNWACVTIPYVSLADWTTTDSG